MGVDVRMTGNGYKDLVVETPGVDFRVHRSVFTDEDHLKREQKTIFSTKWLYLGHATEVAQPGDFVTRTVVGERLIMCRDNSGELRVFFNTCRHRGALVCREPKGNTERFRCLYHAWTCKNSGELVGVAERASFPPSFAPENFGLDSPRYEVYRDFVFVTSQPVGTPSRCATTSPQCCPTWIPSSTSR